MTQVGLKCFVMLLCVQLNAYNVEAARFAKILVRQGREYEKESQRSLTLN